jgi:4,5-DOPA dioxygenase extradiol
VLAYRERAPEAVRAHPTEEHFLPLFVAWGAAGRWPRAVRVHAGIDGAALAMDAYLFEPGPEPGAR